MDLTRVFVYLINHIKTKQSNKPKLRVIIEYKSLNKNNLLDYFLSEYVNLISVIKRNQLIYKINHHGNLMITII